jgi:hypothetical protein
MSFSRRFGLLAGGAALTLTGVSAAAPAGEAQDLSAQLEAANARIAEMEGKLAKIEAANGDGWLTEQRAAEIRGLVQDTLADADMRASLLANGMTSGYDNGFIIGSSDGSFLLRTNLHMQERFIYNMQDADTPASDDHRWGFENTRTKFILTGHVVDPSWYYQVNINVGDGSGRTGTGEALLGHKYDGGLSWQVGTMKAPLLREELVGAQYQLAVERSNVNYFFTTGYVDGLQVAYDQDKWRVAGMLSDGGGSGHTIWSAYDTEYALTGRGEFLAMGTWDQFKDFSSPQGSENGLLLGGAIHYQTGEYGNGFTETDTLLLTADASWESGGWNLFGAIIYGDIDPNIVGLESANPWALVIQGGVFLSEEWELFARYEWTDFDAGPLTDDLSLITLGFNYYIDKNHWKFTTDFGFGLDEVDAAANITGWRVDPADDDGQVVLRSQLQMLF